MQAWVAGPPAAGAARRPLELRDREVPEPAAGELLVRVRACGCAAPTCTSSTATCRLHAREVVPGHEVVGEVAGVGPGVDAGWLSRRVGVAWLRTTFGACRWCRAGRENLCPRSEHTGWDADGGYAELMVTHAAYAYEIPDAFDDLHAAPLLCAGIIGYRRSGSRRSRPADGSASTASAAAHTSRAGAGARLPATPVLRAHPPQRHVQNPGRRPAAADAGARLGVRVHPLRYDFVRADRALADLSRGDVSGSGRGSAD